MNHPRPRPDQTRPRPNLVVILCVAVAALLAILTLNSLRGDSSERADTVGLSTASNLFSLPAPAPTSIPTTAPLALPTEAPTPAPTATTQPVAPTATTAPTPAPIVPAPTEVVSAAPAEAAPAPEPTEEATLDQVAPTATTIPPTAVATAAPAPTATAVAEPTPEPTPTLGPFVETGPTEAPIIPTPTPVPASSSTGDMETYVLGEINAVRAERGLAPVAMTETISTISRDWSQRMGDARGIAHRPKSELGAMLPAGWTYWGENVATAPDIFWAQSALEDSPEHYANMIEPRFTHVGIGVVVANGSVWVTQNFVSY